MRERKGEEAQMRDTQIKRQIGGIVYIRVAVPPDFRRLRLRPFKNKTAPAPGEL